MGTLEQFVVGGRNSRFDVLARKQRAYDAIPTQSALKAHVKRSLFQAGPNVWVQSNVTEQQLSSPSN